jgi:hypothetical protein
MAATNYLDFDLRLERTTSGYRARVRAPGGEGHEEVARDVLDERHFLGDGAAVGRTLFAEVFKGSVDRLYRTTRQQAMTRRCQGVRVRLVLNDTPELAELPWEYLYDPINENFLGLSRQTPIVRYLEQESIPRATVSLPLSVLVAIANPDDGDFERLDAEAELARIRSAFAPLVDAGTILIDVVPHATGDELQRRLSRQQYNVFHYIGHGASAGAPALVLEGADGHDLLGDDDLRHLLIDQTSLELAVLNSCCSGTPDRRHPFGGLAQTLVKTGVPAVIAMQVEVSDPAAIVFAQTLYSSLVDGLPIDAAVAESRKATHRKGHREEWGTPVLYMRSWSLFVPAADRRKASADSASDSTSLRRGVVVVADLLRERPWFRQQLRTFDDAFEAARRQISLMGELKQMHDLLQRLEDHHRIISVSARRARLDEHAWTVFAESARQALYGIDAITHVARKAAWAAEDSLWVEWLEEAARDLHAALETRNAVKLKSASGKLGDVLGQEPSHINTRLVIATKNFDLAVLRQAMEALQPELEAAGAPAVAHLKELRSATFALTNVDTALRELVRLHDQLQEVDDLLRQLDAQRLRKPADMAARWPYLAARLARLCAGHTADWRGKLAELTARAGVVLEDATKTAQRDDAFIGLRDYAVSCFNNVDHELLGMCAQLQHVGGPLALVLRMLQPEMQEA